MRIGIVTQQLRNNYGGLLQNWALQQVLKRMGHEPITLNYENCLRTPPLYRQALSHIKTIFLSFSPTQRRSFIKFRRFTRSLVSQKFIDSHINVTHSFKEYTNKIIKEYRLDCVITGSDQVWRPIYNEGCLDKMFLSFVKNPTLKIAYSASFGVSCWEYSKQDEKICKKYAKKISGISVREQSGIVLCKKYLGVDAVHVLDPTLLLGRVDYDELIKNIPITKDKYLLAYILDQTDENLARTERLSKKMNIPVKIVGADHEMSLPVEEWISIFRNAAFIITNSFHGTVFSILYHVPFISLQNEDRGGERFLDLLGQLNLKERLLKEIPENINILNDIDWNIVELLLEKRRKFSLDWLKEKLSLLP